MFIKVRNLLTSVYVSVPYIVIFTMNCVVSINSMN